MIQKDKKEPGLFDFPLDPTPSLKAYNKFIRCIDEYLAMFGYSEGMLSIDPIELGTPSRAFVKAPIDMDLMKIENILGQTTHTLKKAIKYGEESINWTRKIIKQIPSESPEAEKRNQVIKELMNEIQRCFDEYRDITWHPRCYERIRELFKSSFRSGNPGIPIQITIFV